MFTLRRMQVPRSNRMICRGSSQAQRYLEMRIQTIIQRFNREIPTDKNKKLLVIEMLSIVTDTEVTNEQIQTCIRYLNDMDAWAMSTADTNDAPSLSAYDPDDT